MRFVRWPWNLIEVVGAAVALTGVFYLLPRLDVAPGPDYEHTNDPMEVPLSLTNNGFLTIHPHQVICYVYYWVAENGYSVKNLAYDYTGGGDIGRGESVEFARETPIQTVSRVITADFLVVVDYKQQFWPWTLQKRIRFKTSRTSRDAWSWNRPFLTDGDRSLKTGPNDIAHLRLESDKPSEDNRR